ncbi:esterase FE4-like [Cherax quadricarinatus]
MQPAPAEFLLPSTSSSSVFLKYISIYASSTSSNTGDVTTQDPVAAASWEGVLDVTTMPEPCLQIPAAMALVGVKAQTISVQGSEDCLYLNVFTPKPGDGGNLPVMVWIHGGGFYFGSAREYLPHVLLNQQIVLVVIQYRLSVMGFLSTDDSVIPGNFGLKDQTLALQWVQRNIHNFGGDKNRVTIFGESAGGASVHFQMLTPKAKGLFSRAIMQSGTAVCPWALSRSHADTAQRIARAAGCDSVHDSNKLLKCLKDADADKLTSIAQEIMDWYFLPIRLTARIDGDYLPEEPAVLLREGRFHQVPVITGVTQHEGGLFALPLYLQDSLRSSLETNFPVTGPASVQTTDDTEDPEGIALKLYHHYLGQVKFDLPRRDNTIELMSDRHFKICHDWTSEHHAKHQAAKTYRYELKHHAELSTTDFFGIDFDPPCKFISGILSHMTASGGFSYRNPTPDDSLGFTWSPATDDNLQSLILTPTPFMEADNRRQVRKFHASLSTKVNEGLHPHLVQQLDQPSRERDAQDEL